MKSMLSSRFRSDFISLGTMPSTASSKVSRIFVYGWSRDHCPSMSLPLNSQTSKTTTGRRKVKSRCEFRGFTSSPCWHITSGRICACRVYCKCYFGSSFPLTSTIPSLPSSRRTLSTVVRAGKRITPSEFTEKAWQAITAAPEIAKEYNQQVVEAEHLLKALLEQPNGLARRVLSKAGGDPTKLLEFIDRTLSSRPKIYGDSDQVLGRYLELAVDHAQ